MTANSIKVLGTLLSTYESDLTFIRDFHRHRLGKIDSTEYVKKSAGSFKQFVNDFRIVRNYPAGKTDKLLSLTMDWIKSNEDTDVDGFAVFLSKNGVTQTNARTQKENVPASLASKILFLNNLWKIIPGDRLAKAALKTRK
jgi:hypothetical protein